MRQKVLESAEGRRGARKELICRICYHREMFETFDFYIGKTVSFDSLTRRLVEFKYVRQEHVGAAGEFSLRGGSICLFDRHQNFLHCRTEGRT